MKTKSIKTYKIQMLLLVGIMFIFSNAQGFVHCKSHDGHSKVEFTVNNSCSISNTVISITKPHSYSIQPYSYSNSSCGPCVDTQIFKKYINTSEKDNQVKSITSALPVSLAPTLRNFSFSKFQLTSEFSSSVNPSLTFLRKIIILA
ncbi:hypothetical protein STSP1_02110 [Sedimentisphaera salicampi]|uniref:Uncharacterized protein n=1 Tax=Sedimentisphaera salicampi TaxID=1941349 RepID=A0A1W6LPH9_9BACT|nr:hypothetical protein STSP1_02110 [Sedimentisphaera salicampi]